MRPQGEALSDLLQPVRRDARTSPLRVLAGEIGNLADGLSTGVGEGAVDEAIVDELTRPLQRLMSRRYVTVRQPAAATSMSDDAEQPPVEPAREPFWQLLAAACASAAVGAVIQLGIPWRAGSARAALLAAPS